MFSALLLLVLGIFTNHHYFTFALNDFAFFANGFNRRSDLHVNSSLKTAFCVLNSLAATPPEVIILLSR